jgi:thymidylate synthase
MNNTLDKTYQKILFDIYDNGIWSDNRTGIRSKTIPSAMITHDMSTGFPLLTLKRVPFKTMAVELEGFIKGITSKKWFQDRKCHIWNEWCNPQKVPYGNDAASKEKMAAEDDLGLIYGSQWRDFHVPNAVENYGIEGGFIRSRGVDQLKNIVNTLKKNPNDRRMICSAWNPLALDQMALPPCHALWQVSVIADKINLTWFQRSCDFLLGIPFNVASYGLLLHLLAKESGLEEGVLTGFLNNVHLYENQLEGTEVLMGRDGKRNLPKIETEKFTNIFEWEYSDSSIINYEHMGAVSIPIAV